jgi:hypothetical protein
MKVIRYKILAAAMLALFLTCGCSSSSENGDAGHDDAGDAGNGDTTFCQNNNDCPGEQECISGVCEDVKTCSCNYDCGQRDSNLVCNAGANRCENGTPGTSCNDFCDCYTNETCAGGQCVPSGGDEKTCTSADQCDPDQKCIENKCVPKNCTTRDDCEHAVCLICVGVECTKPPQVCQGTNDCCVGFICNFGTCIPVTEGCLSDDDCENPDYPRCRDEECVPECVNNNDCPNNLECRDNKCVTPGCTIETCQQGYWCNPTAGPEGKGECQQGCDQNSDCTPGEQCNYATHTCEADCCGGCEATQYCQAGTCVCEDKCLTDNDCPADWSCDPPSGICSPALGVEGDPCMVDTDCDDTQGLLCDFCSICSNPPESLTCLFDCSGTYTCPRVDINCQARGFGTSGLRMLCIPQ